MDEQLLNQLLDESGSMLVISLVFSVICSAVCALIASRRNARTGYWAVMGLLFGPFAIPFVFFSKPAADQKQP